MSKSYSKTRCRSRRKRPAEMKGKVLGITEGSVQLPRDFFPDYKPGRGVKFLS